MKNKFHAYMKEIFIEQQRCIVIYFYLLGVIEHLPSFLTSKSQAINTTFRLIDISKDQGDSFFFILGVIELYYL